MQGVDQLQQRLALARARRPVDAHEAAAAAQGAAHSLGLRPVDSSTRGGCLRGRVKTPGTSSEKHPRLTHRTEDKPPKKMWGRGRGSPKPYRFNLVLDLRS